MTTFEVLPLALIVSATPIDIVAVYGRVAAAGELPALEQRDGTWSLPFEPGAHDVSVDAAARRVSYAVDRNGGVFESVEVVAFPTPGNAVVAIAAIKRDTRVAPGRAPTTLRAWRLTDGHLKDDPKALASVPFLEAFVAPVDRSPLANLDDADITPWVSRQVSLSAKGLTVRFDVSALGPGCRAKPPAAPELLCRNEGALTATRSATWNPKLGVFRLDPPPARAGAAKR